MRQFPLPTAIIKTLFLSLALSLGTTGLAAQSQPSNIDRQSGQVATTDRDLGATQEEFLRLLRMSPKLTTVVARDPSLLANQEYVTHNNPALGQFLLAHPEVARNPEFYLFNNVGSSEGRNEQALERKVWPEIPEHEQPFFAPSDVIPFVIFVCILGALLWLIRLLLENRRWSRIFKLQTDVHGKLIEKFGTNQELLTYMGTEAGKRFLEAAPITVDFERSQPVPSPVARVLTPLQIGIVLSLLGAGFLYLRHSLTDGTVPLLVFGTLTLMLGFGFIISAGVTWFLAKHLGLMPSVTESQEAQLHDLRNRQ